MEILGYFFLLYLIFFNVLDFFFYNYRRDFLYKKTSEDVNFNKRL